MPYKVTDFKAIKLKMASPEDILGWSHGEVTKPETINYRTQKPEKEGLFCEKIFGPEKDWECYCGKYKRIRYKGIICDKCGVEVTRAIVRRERMGHIALAAPVSHIWFLRGVPSKIGLILDMGLQELERVIYFASYLVIKVDETAREQALEEIEKEFKLKSKSLPEGSSIQAKQALKEQRDKAIAELKNLKPLETISENDYYDLSIKYGQVFEAGIGAEAVRKALKQVDLGILREELLIEKEKTSDLAQKKAVKRLRIVEAMARAGLRPEWMIVTMLPVLPPDLRPMVALDGGRYATSDLNDLYRRVINRNNRLKKLIELNAPEVICRNEKRMLQEAVDALIDNSARRGQGPVMAATGQKRQLRSLADMLKGKQGRFRQNLLGKRVDYSGRSVIVVGPELKIYQCGLPKYMALELFKPFVIQKIVDRGLAHNIRGAGHLIEQEIDEVWEILEEAIQDKSVLLNRAPTLHRLGIQAFKPVLIEGSAIQIHPLVCPAFNADFDGDQMAVHLPLTAEAQDEASKIMLSANNLLKPATGDPIATPRQDMILGIYWMTKMADSLKGEGKYFVSSEEAILNYHYGQVDLRAKIKVKISSLPPIQNVKGSPEIKEGDKFVETCAGRLIFNQILPLEIGFFNTEMKKKAINGIVAELIAKCGVNKASVILDKIKEIGFEYATYSGISWGMDDLHVPKEKKDLLAQAEKEVETVHSQYVEGLLTREERRSRIIEIWFSIVDELGKLVIQELDPEGSVHLMVDSGSRGSWGQTSQMMGMRGLMVNPAGEIIELPVKSSFKEGLNVLEYFISTHGARKGSSDTALRTSTAGYLTRRLVDVSQDLVITGVDCGDDEGTIVHREDGKELGRSLASRIVGRVSLEEIKHDGQTIVGKNALIDKEAAEKIDKLGVETIRVRSVLTCKSRHGMCQMCYGYDLGKNQLVKLGEAVGVVTAQAIGEPGTQLTMKTFHTGGVAGGGDITQGLPRVEEIFESRIPKGKALMSEIDGKVIEIKEENNRCVVKIAGRIEIVPPGAKKTKSGKTAKIAEKDKVYEDQVREYVVPSRTALWIKEGEAVTKGQQLNEGHLDLKELFKLAGRASVQRYIIREVQNIYTSQGEGINDKHIEIIIRQMFSRVRVKDPGETNLLIGDVVEKQNFMRENDAARAKGAKTATAAQLLLGISKVALTTESWLSAASFQETTRVLINAASQAKEDKLRGLKENVIIGRLIPAGTGFRHEEHRQENKTE
ncbi:MAG: DNA-directed RNA polymerase subunit beta' [Parcubacteria group bacterium GW2011_GWB1_42_6]|nr:MAG: DNA-directed RNA polymerase subunit beta' [Parcubacteria group bacterium GW2011_GWB1_42_6]